MTRHLLLLGATLATLVCASARAAEAPVVGEVLVEGNRRVEADAVRAAVATKAGKPLDAARIGQDVRAVMGLGFFSDVVVEERGDPARPTIVFRVAEKPAIKETRIVGNKELSNDDLKDVVDIKANSILDLNQVRKNVKKIQEKYVEKGYYLAEITYRLEDQPDNQVVLVFEVNEHAKVQVRSIQFIGNRNVPRDDLLAVMSTQEGGLLSFLSSSGTYREEAFQRDLQNIQFIYGDRGYLYAKVAKPTVAISPDKRFLSITIRVEEGDQYRVGAIDFSGDLSHDKPELSKLIQVRTGDVFARSKVGKDLIAIADLYKDDGYAYANVNPETRVDAAARTVDLTYDIQPGRKVHFERIEITGNSKTRDKVIRRELRIYEGELFSNAGLVRSKARVTALGYFETVNVTTERGSTDDAMVARVQVKERSTGSFQLGAGFSSYENFILTGQISQNNFLGWGQTLSLQLSYSSVRQLGQIEFVEPYFFDTKWTFAFNLYATEGSYATFTRKAYGGSMTWGYELNGLAWFWPWASNLEDVRLFATYTAEQVSVTANGLDQVLLYNRFRSGATSALRLTLQIDKRDNRLFPTKGWYQSASAELAPPLLAPDPIFGSQVNLFTRYSYDFRAYHPVVWGVVARAKLSAGYIAGWDSDHPVPISELYYLGGINSVRGYRMLSLSPTVPASSCRADCTSFDFPSGGNKQVTLNLEAEIPISEKIGIKGVVFFDMGNTFRQGTWSDPAVSLSLYKSWGFGLRWVSPLGPLRFEWGFPLDRRFNAFTRTYQDSAVDFQFTIGNFF